MAESSVGALVRALATGLSLTANEQVDLALDEAEGSASTGEDTRWCLIGTVLIKKRYNMEALERTLADIWRPVKGMHMRILGDNFFAFYFFHLVDMQRVFADGLWFFVNHVPVLKAAEPGRQVCHDDLFEVPFWIQIYDLPPDPMTMASGQKIGAEMGHLLDVDAGDGKVWANEYIRVRVTVDARKPLRRGMKLTLKEGPIWVLFRYERLPNLYYCCGKLDHVEWDCELGLEMVGVEPLEKPYTIICRQCRGKCSTEVWLIEIGGFETAPEKQ
ncbi:hypothetical protein SLE2022_374340 [Rubroshorea leprosula]